MANTLKSAVATGQLRKNSGPAGPSVRRRLLQSAERLFAENEYSSVRLSDVAAAASTTTTMITYHFGNRQTLYGHAVEASLSRLTQRFEKARSMRPGAPIDGMIKTLIEGLGDERFPRLLLQRELLRQPQNRSNATQRCLTRLLELILGSVAAARRAGSIQPNVEPAVFSHALLSMALQTAILWPAAAPILGTRLEGEGLEQLVRLGKELASHGFAPESRQFDLFST